ncbi:MAG TPA: TatD family hydrolase [Candidatus Acidoferrales bacterium]|nr:TatD family hydrolase [Candidatus Acidoferrales bacterium]
MSAPSLDAHAHLDARASVTHIARAGFVLAMTLNADEAALALGRRDARVVWGVGCHPRRARAVRAFDRDRFAKLASLTPLVGEVGLDASSRVPRDEQLAAFRGALAVAHDLGRVVSVHPHKTSGAVLDEIRRRPPPAVILHWWSGDAHDTKRAVRLGCYFSVHRAVADRLVWREVPPERLLVESDSGYEEAPLGIPARLAATERLLAARIGADAATIREGAWRALAELIRNTDTLRLWPFAFREQFRASG